MHMTVKRETERESKWVVMASLGFELTLCVYLQNPESELYTK